jgi:2-polyprenyl-6-methoxyphenol hydroxylase-like FAD-dependent oxidoreductase
VPHFLQPHAFLARGIKELREHAPDIYSALLDEGAMELRLFEKMPSSPPHAEDRDLLFLGCRRSVIEWVMRNTVSAQPNVEVQSGATARGLLWSEEETAIPRASGVLTDAGPLRADLVVDAMGRSSPLSEWIVAGGGGSPVTQSDDCGTVYYSRYFRFRPGCSFPQGPWLLGPRAELGYLETGTFWGDNRTFALVQQIAADDRQLRVLRHADKYMVSLRAQPTLAPLIEDDVSEPITPVLAMGQLRNTLKDLVPDGSPTARGVIAVGDALCHTNPRYAWGLSLGLAQSFLFANLVAEHGRDLDSLALAFDEQTRPWTSAVFRTATATDNERKRYWSGAPIDFTTPADALHLFLLMVFPMAAMRDPEIFRKAVRRLTLLDDPESVENDQELLQRAVRIVKEEFAGAIRARQGPSRSELKEILQATPAT